MPRYPRHALVEPVAVVAFFLFLPLFFFFFTAGSAAACAAAGRAAHKHRSGGGNGAVLDLGKQIRAIQCFGLGCRAGFGAGTPGLADLAGLRSPLACSTKPRAINS